MMNCSGIPPVPSHPPTTQAEAEEPEVRSLYATSRPCPVHATKQEERLAAIVDFTFNLGAGRLQTSAPRRRVDLLDGAEAAGELQRWVHGGGKVPPGLVHRRLAEASLLHERKLPGPADEVIILFAGKFAGENGGAS